MRELLVGQVERRLDDTAQDDCELYTNEYGRQVNRSIIVSPDPTMGRVRSAMNFVRAIEGSEKPLNTPDEALNLMRLIDGAYQSAATGKPVNHIATNNICEDCHVTANWTTIHFDHSAVSGTCASCHNGTTATGKPVNHIATNNVCEDCHVTANWTTIHFDHSAVSGTCASCHNGKASHSHAVGAYTEVAAPTVTASGTPALPSGWALVQGTLTIESGFLPMLFILQDALIAGALAGTAP